MMFPDSRPLWINLRSLTCSTGAHEEHQMPTKRSVLVAGATGQQGGAVAQALLAKRHRVRALTRKPESDIAQRLMSAGAELVNGDLGDTASVLNSANGVDTVFLMGHSNDVGSDG